MWASTGQSGRPNTGTWLPSLVDACGIGVMVLFHRTYDWLARRYTKRGLARTVVVLAIALLVSQLVLVWYFGTVGLSLREMGYDDDRTVILDEADHLEFARHYDETVEVGWCLFGSVNQTYIRIADVVPAAPLSQGSGHVDFTCIEETAGQMVGLENAHLIGTAHSHPSHDRSRLSRVDTMTWGRTSPVIKVMGIYTNADGVKFFSVSSMLHPLETDVR